MGNRPMDVRFDISEDGLTGIMEDDVRKVSDIEAVEEQLQKVSGKDKHARITGVVIGKIVSFGENGKAYVDFHLNPETGAIAAETVSALRKDDTGLEVALIFQNGDPHLPIIIGPVIRSGDDNSVSGKDQDNNSNSGRPLELTVDKKIVTITADEEIILKCGKSSITLTRAGKIIIRGKYILSRSSGVNSIKGGSVQIN